LHLILFGLVYYEKEFISTGEGDYSKWLGPDWKPQFDHAGAVIMNHVCFMDILIGLVHFFPSFVAKRSIKSYPFVGSVARAIDCVFLDRAGTKEEKIAVAKQIEDR
jgi:Acyltransferase